jgi:hypothetical protein
MSSPDPGDQVYLGTVLANLHFWGVVSDLDTPAMMTGTFEMAANDGAVTMDALVGPPGPPGENAAIVKMQYQSTIDDPDDLPDNLTSGAIDIGKTWWVGNNVYMWSGTQFVVKQMGVMGPPGPYPHIHPSVELLDPDGDDSTEIVTSGTTADPGWLLKLKVPRGETGAAGPIRDAEDYDNSVPPLVGEAITWNGTHYAPGKFDTLSVRAYSLPQASFVSFNGITTRQQIAAFAVPPQPFDWKPLVWGHIRAIGVELDADPLILGCEVRLGSTAGTLVGRGFGNISTYATIIPHFSTPSSGSDAITPENGTALVPAYHSGSQGTVFVSLFNDGIAGAYSFDQRNAQLTVMVVPTSDFTVEPGS